VMQLCRERCSEGRTSEEEAEVIPRREMDEIEQSKMVAAFNMEGRRK
jgi:hypothetical protein